MVTMEIGANNPAKPRHARSAFMGLVQWLLIVVIFAVVGPVVGTIVIAVLLGLIQGTASGLAQIPLTVIAGLISGGSYVFGGVPAAIAGVMIGIKQAWFGGAGWLFALVIGGLVGVGLEIFVHGASIKADHSGLIGVLLVVATVSTLACWRIVTTWSFVREANP
jgi:hypothetical protein